MSDRKKHPSIKTIWRKFAPLADRRRKDPLALLAEDKIRLLSDRRKRVMYRLKYLLESEEKRRRQIEDAWAYVGRQKILWDEFRVRRRKQKPQADLQLSRLLLLKMEPGVWYRYSVLGLAFGWKPMRAHAVIQRARDAGWVETEVIEGEAQDMTFYATWRGAVPRSARAVRLTAAGEVERTLADMLL